MIVLYLPFSLYLISTSFIFMGRFGDNDGEYSKLTCLFGEGQVDVRF